MDGLIPPSSFQKLLKDTFVSHVEHHRQIDSTNNRARRIVLGQEPLLGLDRPCSEALSAFLPCLILADRQTAGRGRGTNRWWTGSGSLAMTLLLPPVSQWQTLFPLPAPKPEPKKSSRPETPWPSDSAFSGANVSSSLGEGEKVPLCWASSPERFPEDSDWGSNSLGLIGLASALAVVHTVKPILPGVLLGLHWPNDVFAAGKKLAGVLVEILATGEVIIGIGVNTNNTAQEAPKELQAHVATLRDLTGRCHGHEEFLIDLLDHLKEFFCWLAHCPERLAAQAHHACLQKGRFLKVQTSGGDVCGTCEGVGPKGELLLKTPNGIRRIFSGTVLESTHRTGGAP